MALSVSTALFFILSCGLWVTEARPYTSILTVPNGAGWGRWGPVQFCNKGHAVGFQTKIEPYIMGYDSTGINAIALLCDDGETVTSTIGPWGFWQKPIYCHESKLVAFALRTREATEGDYTTVNGIAFLCSGNEVYYAVGNTNGRFGQKSNHCTKGYICGIQTRVQSPQYIKDDTAINDVKMFCCD